MLYRAKFHVEKLSNQYEGMEAKCRAKHYGSPYKMGNVTDINGFSNRSVKRIGVKVAFTTITAINRYVST